ncbi:uncharacterized protein A4U43_C03F21720 [Asparagus officinalis]|uniref:Uncharacterized protein n=1 Tax=Asparagus officinalis TaxID=4686 RepID=A0A5P1FES4_ASPOF|nr:uncharacterized protein A4U43_C03F21720 [Asparagus officinalis]
MADIYEARRRKTIDENIARMRALGIPPLSQTFFRTLPMDERKSKGSKKNVCEDDDEYLPSMDDNLLSSSSEDVNDDLEEVTRMAPGRKSKNIIPSTSMPERRILLLFPLPLEDDVPASPPPLDNVATPLYAVAPLEDAIPDPLPADTLLVVAIPEL